MILSRRLWAFCLLTLSILATSPVSAQTAQTSPATSPAQAAPQSVNQSLPSDLEEVTILRDDYAGKYNNSTLENLSRLYWRLGAFDLDDSVAVGNFMKINDCKIYTEYFNDDLEWKKIVEVMKGHIKKARDSYPLDYQFILQINLGRYDPVLKGFPLVNKTGFTDAKRIEVDSIDRNKNVCYDEAPIQDYPKSIMILLPEPFTFNFVKLDEHVAQAYILRKKAEFAALSDDQKLRQYERNAFLRLRVTFSQYHGNLRGDNNTVMAILFGRIDGYEIFEDVQQKRLMASVELLPVAGAASTPVAPTTAPAQQPAALSAAAVAPAPQSAAPVTVPAPAQAPTPAPRTPVVVPAD